MLETWGSLGGTWEPGAGFNVPLYNWAINTYASNGDALSMTDSVMGAWSYTYDDFNRLASGNATAGVDSGLSLGWTYDRGPRRQVFVAGVEDRYGNRWAQNATGSGNASAVQPQLSFTGNSNHVDGWSYDDAGNPGSPESDSCSTGWKLLNDLRNSYASASTGA
jgi:hypothetical protein